MRLFAFLVFLLMAAPALAQPVVQELQFDGMNRSNPDFLAQFLQTRSGQPLNWADVEADIQTLRNMQQFTQVEASVDTLSSGEVVVRFAVEEFIMRIPTINFGGITDNFWFQLGGVDLNWLGRGYELGGYYRYYDRHSFSLYQSMPYLLGRRWGFKYNLDQSATTEPAYIGDQTVQINADRLSFVGLVRYELYNAPRAGHSSSIQIGGGYLREKYQPLTGNIFSNGTRSAEFNKYLLKFRHEFIRLNYFSHYLWGLANETNIQTVKTDDGPFDYWQFLNVLRMYARYGSRINLAARLRSGIATNTDSPFVPFVLDSFLTVRGSGNRVSRGTAELTLNLESRFTLSEDHWLAWQGLVFIDISAWRFGGAPFTSMFSRDNTVTFGGAGFRIHLKQLYQLTFRLDYGINLIDNHQRGFVLGLGQYF